MGRYRVDNKYLSKQEYQNRIDVSWAIWLFVIGAFSGCFGGYNALLHFELNYLELWQTFLIIICTSVGSGYLLSKLRKLIRILLRLFAFGLDILIISGILLSAL